MANEINFPYASGYTIFITIRNAAGQVWYLTGEAMETWGNGSRTAADYDIALTDKSGGFYVGDMDTSLPAGNYILIFYQQAGEAPADTDYPLASQKGYWNGTAWRAIEEIVQALNDVTVDNVWDEVMESTVTARQAMKAILAVLTGKSSGGRTNSITFRDIADSKNRITATVDAAGNRTAVTRILS